MLEAKKCSLLAVPIAFDVSPLDTVRSALSLCSLRPWACGLTSVDHGSPSLAWHVARRTPLENRRPSESHSHCSIDYLPSISILCAPWTSMLRRVDRTDRTSARIVSRVCESSVRTCWSTRMDSWRWKRPKKLSGHAHKKSPRAIDSLDLSLTEQWEEGRGLSVVHCAERLGWGLVMVTSTSERMIGTEAREEKPLAYIQIYKSKQFYSCLQTQRNKPVVSRSRRVSSSLLNLARLAFVYHSLPVLSWTGLVVVLHS